MVSVHLRVFQKLSRIDSLAKICTGKKVIIFAVDFTRTRASSCTGDGVKKTGTLANPFHKCGLACPRWSRNYKKNSASAEFFTQDFGLARESFPVPPCMR